MALTDDISSWIKNKVKDSGAFGVVIGLSGGVDSAVTAILCKKSFPKHTFGVIMPCFSNTKDMLHAKELAEKFAIEYKVVELADIYSSLYQKLEGREYVEAEMNLALANLKPRLRMATLYYFANKLNYIVAGTGNKSEAVMGYFTKYGDGGVDILPLGGLLKREVYQLARELNVPQEIISKAPSAGLWEGQTDEGEMGITYEELDKTIEQMESGHLVEDKSPLVLKIKERMANSRHKFECPPSFRSS